MCLYFTDFDFRWTMQGGLKMLSIRLDLIESTRIVTLVVDLSCWESICVRHFVRIKSSRKVPHTNWLSLGVLDIDVLKKGVRDTDCFQWSPHREGSEGKGLGHPPPTKSLKLRSSEAGFWLSEAKSAEGYMVSFFLSSRVWLHHPPPTQPPIELSHPFRFKSNLSTRLDWKPHWLAKD